MKTRILALFLLFTALAVPMVSGSTQTPQRSKPMSEPIGVVFVGVFPDVASVPTPPTIENVEVVYLAGVSPDRLIVKTSTGDVREYLHTYDEGVDDRPTAYQVPIINTNGDIGNRPSAAKQVGTITTGIDPIPFTIPQGMADRARTGQIVSVLTPSSNEGLGGSPVQQGYRSGPIVLIEDVDLDLNSSTPVALFTPDTDEKTIATQLVFHDPSGAVTTARGNWGFNASTYDDVQSNQILTALDATDAVRTINAKSNAKIGAAGATLYFVASTLEGSARTCKVDILGYVKR